MSGFGSLVSRLPLPIVQSSSFVASAIAGFYRIFVLASLNLVPSSVVIMARLSKSFALFAFSSHCLSLATLAVPISEFGLKLMTPNVMFNHTMHLKSCNKTFPLSIQKAHTYIAIDNSSL
jgi:hypothetical protein